MVDPKNAPTPIEEDETLFTPPDPVIQTNIDGSQVTVDASQFESQDLETTEPPLITTPGEDLRPSDEKPMPPGEVCAVPETNPKRGPNRDSNYDVDLSLPDEPGVGLLRDSER